MTSHPSSSESRAFQVWTLSPGCIGRIYRTHNPPHRPNPGTIYCLSLSHRQPLNFYLLQILAVKKILWVVSWAADLDHAAWDDKVTQWLNFVSHSVLGLPILLMTLMLYITPALDEMCGNLDALPLFKQANPIQLHGIIEMGRLYICPEAQV